MDAQRCILTRRSVRQFADRPVSRELLEKVVSLASYAPVSYTHLDVYKRQLLYLVRQ